MLKAKLLASGTAAKTYVDDVFSAYTYTGDGTTQTITNGIDLAGMGGLVWIKNRSNTVGHFLFDNLRGTNYLATNTTAAQADLSSYFSGFTSSGFGLTSSYVGTNGSAIPYVSWTFRKADNFYNHTTVVKTGGSNATVSFANLTTLGMVRVKRTDSTGSWYIWHRSLTAGKLLIGETTAAEATLGHITVSGTTVTLVNGVIADGTYLVEGFAHDTGPDGLIQCGSYVAGAGDETITLGWEPQFIMECRFIGTGSGLLIQDSARGLSMTSAPMLSATTSAAESAPFDYTHPSATGYTSANGGWGSGTILYLAIRRPNKPPTTGTQVYSAIARTGTGAAATVTGVGFAPDLAMIDTRNTTLNGPYWCDRLRGANNFIKSASTAGENPSLSNELTAFGMDGVSLGASSNQNTNYTWDYANWFFKRAPGVFDVVCYTGTGSATTVAHGLGAVPELMIVKKRSATDAWYVYVGSLGATKELLLNMTLGEQSDGAALWNSAAPTSSVFSLGTDATVNQSTGMFVTYLFATLAGISKVGSYTGTATTNAINCGFTTGARFVMIKRTDSTGDWYVWDTTRGIIAGNDPYLLLNSTAAENTTTDYIDPSTSGFELSSTAPAAINASGGTFIYLAFS